VGVTAAGGGIVTISQGVLLAVEAINCFAEDPKLTVVHSLGWGSQPQSERSWLDWLGGPVAKTWRACALTLDGCQPNLNVGSALAVRN
jgi:hypothetical protein